MGFKLVYYPLRVASWLRGLASSSFSLSEMMTAVFVKFKLRELLIFYTKLLDFALKMEKITAENICRMKAYLKCAFLAITHHFPINFCSLSFDFSWNKENHI